MRRFLSCASLLVLSCGGDHQDLPERTVLVRQFSVDESSRRSVRPILVVMEERMVFALNSQDGGEPMAIARLDRAEVEAFIASYLGLHDGGEGVAEGPFLEIAVSVGGDDLLSMRRYPNGDVVGATEEGFSQALAGALDLMPESGFLIYGPAPTEVLDEIKCF